jgi:hypothetical protein
MKKGKTDIQLELQNQLTDHFTSAAKVALGFVPYAGSLLAELAGSIIPNQRIDRLCKFATELEIRLSEIEHELVRSKLVDETFTDLLEEGMRQAARSVSDERRQYIASLLANGIASTNVSFIESKHLLWILGEINDIEIIWLRYHLVPAIDGDKEFRNKHQEFLKPVRAYIGCDQAILDNHALNQSYLEHMAQLGLLAPQHEVDIETKQPTFDKISGRFKVRGYDITLLGKLILRQISLIP